MSNSKNKFKELIFTNHVLKRMGERNISQKDVWLAWYKPDQSRFSKNKQTWIYHKTWNGQKTEVVAKKNEKNEWIVISAWSKPVNENTTPSSTQKNISLPQILLTSLKRFFS